MPQIKPFKNIHKTDVNIAGGKGASLGEMVNAGIAVPPGFVIVADAFDRFIKETHLNQEIKARLAEVNVEDTNSIQKASATLRDVIADTAMPEELSTEIIQAFSQLGADYVAVRSSATAEDSAIASWAGELDTFLNTTEEHLIEKVKECWSSLYTPRAIFYRHEKNLVDHHVSVAVVVQSMIQSEVSGVAFTVHPVTEDRNQMIIEAGLGLGEAIVSGQITPDSYVVSKSDMTLLDITVGQQRKRLDRAGDIKIKDTANVWTELGEEGEKQKLSGRQIIVLAELCKKIEEHYDAPCDIEWAFADGNFYITQSRPITTLK
jgi:pyruvate, water dikinase